MMVPAENDQATALHVQRLGNPSPARVSWEVKSADGWFGRFSPPAAREVGLVRDQPSQSRKELGSLGSRPAVGLFVEQEVVAECVGHHGVGRRSLRGRQKDGHDAGRAWKNSENARDEREEEEGEGEG